MTPPVIFTSIFAFFSLAHCDEPEEVANPGPDSDNSEAPPRKETDRHEGLTARSRNDTDHEH